MNTNDPIRERLLAWQAPAVPPGFATAVRARIASEPPEREPWFLARWAFSSSLAASLLLWMLVLKVSAPSTSTSWQSLKAPGELAQAYSVLMKGSTP